MREQQTIDNQRGSSIFEVVLVIGMVTVISFLVMLAFVKKPDVLLATPHASDNNSAPTEKCAPTRSTTNSF